MKICLDFPNLVKKSGTSDEDKYALLLSATLNLHRSVVFELNCIRLLGWPRGV